MKKPKPTEEVIEDGWGKGTPWEKPEPESSSDDKEQK